MTMIPLSEYSGRMDCFGNELLQWSQGLHGENLPLRSLHSLANKTCKTEGY